MTLRLERLRAFNAIGWQRHCEEIEEANANLQSQITDIATALASVSEVAPITITADYQGTVDPSDQLPLDIAIKRYAGATDVTSSTAWSVALATGDITATIGAATGILDITAVGSSGTLTVTSVYQAITKTRLVSVTKTIASPPSTGSGGGGTTSSDTSFASINSSTHAPISDELTVTVGGSGTVTLTAVLSVRTSRASPTGTFPVWGKWQWWNGAAWADVAAEVISNPDCDVSLVGGIYQIDNGSLTVNTSKTGLAAAASEKFRLMARNGLGTRNMSFSGTASAVP